jgi:hypothetical protein
MGATEFPRLRNGSGLRLPAVALVVQLSAAAGARMVPLGRGRDGQLWRGLSPEALRLRRGLRGGLHGLHRGSSGRLERCPSAAVQVVAQGHRDEAIKRQPEALGIGHRLRLKLGRQANGCGHKGIPGSQYDTSMPPLCNLVWAFPPCYRTGGEGGPCHHFDTTCAANSTAHPARSAHLEASDQWCQGRCAPPSPSPAPLSRRALPLKTGFRGRALPPWPGNAKPAERRPARSTIAAAGCPDGQRLPPLRGSLGARPQPPTGAHTNGGTHEMGA